MYIGFNIKNKLEGILMDILNRKDLAKQRTISLYKHQEEEINKINEILISRGEKELSYAELIRFAIDEALPKLRKNLG